MGKKKGKSKAKGAPKTAPRRALPRERPLHHGPPRPHIQEALSAVAKHFSLRDEARLMSNHRSSAFDSTKKLRNIPIAFVSAGYLEGTIKEVTIRAEPANRPSPSPIPSPSQSPAAIAALAHMTLRSPSPAPTASSSSSASSEELVVFRGRGHPSSAQKETPTLTFQPCTAPVPGAAALEPTTRFHTRPAPSAAVSVPSRTQSDIDSDANIVVDSHFEKRRSGRARWEGKATEWVSRSKPGVGWLPVNDRNQYDNILDDESDPRDAAMDDYLQNTEAFGLTNEMVGFASRRELDLDAGSHNDWESDEELELPPQLEQDEDDGWTSEQAHDLDLLSTSDEVEGIVARVTGRRSREDGTQYQVVYEGSTRDDARWLPLALLTSPSDKVLIEAYEVNRSAQEQQQLPSSNSNSESEFDVGDDISEDEDELDDEQLARALQRQEDLGIDDDDLVLYGADAYFSSPADATSGPARATFNHMGRKQQRAGKGRRAEPAFPSASALADALDMDSYSGFDIMDTERPSLRLKKKGRRGQMPPELDDPDLNEQLQASWDADRRKKRLKKAEREELRRQGLLGRKEKTPALDAKYRDGFVMDDVIEEIRDFWAADMATLSLPAMEAHRRAIIHQFVNEFGINSKSRGEGTKRYTMLSKTVRTLRFDDDLFDRTLAQKKYTRRLHMVAKYPPQQKKEKGTKNRSTVSYKDGEVVGATAPELGIENKGRAMLEKMGWSKGMALGAMDNKGILQPITHTVKITKAGLR